MGGGCEGAGWLTSILDPRMLMARVVLTRAIFFMERQTMVSYGTEAGFIEYHEARGREVPATWIDEIEPALLVASEWLDGTYGSFFVGQKTGGYLQDREWPRMAAVTNTEPPYVFADDEIPNDVVKATYEAAYRHLQSPGSLLRDYTPMKYKKAAVDGAVSVEYAAFNFASDTQTQIPIIDRLLSSLFDPTSGADLSSYSGSSVRA